MVVLLGDSVFDNAAYVGGGSDVAQQLRTILTGDWQVTLLAVDGHVIADVPANSNAFLTPHPISW